MKIRSVRPNTRHVMAGMDRGWIVRKHRSKRASKRFDTKADALSWGRDLSRRRRGMLVIHRDDGTVEDVEDFADKHHVLRSLDGGWSVWREGTKRASKRFEIKEDAVAWGRALSRKHGSELVIHRSDGTVQARYGP